MIISLPDNFMFSIHKPTDTNYNTHTETQSVHQSEALILNIWQKVFGLFDVQKTFIIVKAAKHLEAL